MTTKINLKNLRQGDLITITNSSNNWGVGTVYKVKGVSLPFISVKSYNPYVSGNDKFSECSSMMDTRNNTVIRVSPSCVK